MAATHTQTLGQIRVFATLTQIKETLHSCVRLWNLFFDVFRSILDVGVALPAFLNVTLQQLRRGAIPLPFIDVCIGIPLCLNPLVFSSMLSNQRELRPASVRFLLKWLDGCFKHSASQGHLQNSKKSLVIVTVECVCVREPHGLFTLERPNIS